MARHLALLFGVVSLLGGCHIRPEPILDPDEPSNIYQNQTFGSPSVENPIITNFRSAFVASSQNPSSPVLARTLLVNGLTANHQNCMEFFRSAGIKQQRLLFAKDVIAILGSVGTGVMALTGAGTGGTAALALGTATSVTAINTYQADFLFSQDNVQAVDDMVMTAVATQEGLAVTASNAATYSFGDAVRALWAAQNTCEVQKILSLTREAIKAADIVAAPSSTGAAPTVRVKPK